MLGVQSKTRLATAASAALKTWYVVDATDQILGRLASRVALVLMGKHKPTYTAYIDTGDPVIVLNAEKVRLTGRKPEKKTYQRYSGVFGSHKYIPFKAMMAKNPAKIIELAVRGMLPKTTLGRQMLDKLNVYAGAEHPHAAQQPKPFPLKIGRYRDA